MKRGSSVSRAKRARKLSQSFYFEIHGVSFHIDSLSQETFLSIVSFLNPFKIEHKPSPTYEILIHQTSHPKPLPTKSLSWIRTRPLSGYETEEGALVLGDDSSQARVDYKEKRIEFWIHRDMNVDSDYFLRSFFLLPVIEALRSEGLLYIHGAAFRHHELEFLVLGDGGQGKSTLSASVLSDDGKILADDNMLLDLDSQGPRLRTLEREVRIHSEIRKWLPFETEDLYVRGKISIPFYRIPDRFLCSEIRPEVCLVLGGQYTTEPRPIPVSEVFHVLVKENPLILLKRDLVAKHLRAIQVLLQNTETYGVNFRMQNLNRENLIEMLKEAVRKIKKELGPRRGAAPSSFLKQV